MKRFQEALFALVVGSGLVAVGFALAPSPGPKPQPAIQTFYVTKYVDRNKVTYSEPKNLYDQVKSMKDWDRANAKPKPKISSLDWGRQLTITSTPLDEFRFYLKEAHDHYANVKRTSPDTLSIASHCDCGVRLNVLRH